MEDVKSAFSNAGNKLCLNCSHSNHLGRYDHCYGTPEKSRPNYVRGGMDVLYLHPLTQEYRETRPYLKDVNTDGNCRYFKERPVQPEPPTVSTRLMDKLRHFFKIAP